MTLPNVPATYDFSTYGPVWGYLKVHPITGDLYFFFRDGPSLEKSEGGLYLSISDDNGETWGSPITLIYEQYVNQANPVMGFKSNGDLIIVIGPYTSESGNITNWDGSGPPEEDNIWTGTVHVYRMANGTTSVTEISTWDTDATLYATYGKLIEMSNGELALMWYQSPPKPSGAGKEWSSHLYVSTDDFVTWTDVSTVPTSWENTEADLLELANGQIILSHRVNAHGYAVLYTSTDYGRTWSYRGQMRHFNYAVEGGNNPCPQWLEKYIDTDGRMVVVMSYYLRGQPNGEQELHRSYAFADEIMSKGIDAFRRDHDFVVLDTGSSAGYSQLANLGDGAFVVSVSGALTTLFRAYEDDWTRQNPVTYDYNATNTGAQTLDIERGYDMIRFDGIAPTKSQSGDLVTYTWGGGSDTLEVSFFGENAS